MAKQGKRYNSLVQAVSSDPLFKHAELEGAIQAVKSCAKAKFDETVDVAIRLGVDPRHADQQVRGTVVLPNGTGKSIRVLVLTKGEKVKEAEAAGADMAGSDEFLTKIKEGWLEFDAMVATPDMMAEVGKLGKVLGPRGLMPNPKAGTVTFDVTKAVKELKAGTATRTHMAHLVFQTRLAYRCRAVAATDNSGGTAKPCQHFGNRHRALGKDGKFKDPHRPVPDHRLGARKMVSIVSNRGRANV